MPEKLYKKKHLTSFQLIILGVAGVILLGTFLLMLPVSSLERVPTPFHEALVYSHFRSMCDRTCGKGYRKLLVPVRTDNYSCTDTDWWTWGCNGSRMLLSLLIRKKNIPYAKKHHAGCDFST